MVKAFEVWLYKCHASASVSSLLVPAQLLLSLRLGLGLHIEKVGDAGPTDRLSRQAHLGISGSRGASGRFLTPPPERRIHPAAPVRFAGLPDKSGVPIGMAARLGGGVGMRSGASRGALTRIFHRRTEGTVYGVPALAGQTRPRQGAASVSSRRQGTTPCRLKPGLHTPHQAHVCYRNPVLTLSLMKYPG